MRISLLSLIAAVCLVAPFATHAAVDGLTPTTTRVTATPTHVVVGTTVNVSASVTSQFGPLMGAVVDMQDNGAPLAGCNIIIVVKASGTCTVQLTVGQHTIVGSVTATPTFGASVSAPVIVVVTGAVSPTSLNVLDEFGKCMLAIALVLLALAHHRFGVPRNR